MSANIADPVFKAIDGHEINNPLGWNFCGQCRGQGEIDKFQLPPMMRVSAH